MRALVTGASGHLGSYLAERLVREGAEVFILVRPKSNLWRLNEVLDRVKVVEADLADVARLTTALNQVKPEAVFHLAWQGVASALKNDPVQVTDNVCGSLNLFEAVRTTGCKVWIGTGSQAEYGSQEEILTEDTPLHPLTAYGVGKLCVGLLTKKLCELSNIRYVWFRLLATYGTKDDETHLIPTVIRHLLVRERPSLTLGEQLWDYLHVEDAAEAIYRAAICEQAQGVFNLGSGQTHSLRSIVERIRDLIDPTLPLGFGDVAYPPDQLMRLATSIERLHAATGWMPRVEIDEGLRRTIEWYRAQTAG
jgi:UDP-glucose 4-epimerase